MYSYCLFCETRKCAAVAQTVTERFPCRAISPKIQQRRWRKGQSEEVEHDYLPGYVFIYAELPLQDFQTVRSVEGVLRCLSDGEHSYQLQGADERFAEMLLRCNGTIGTVKVYREGERIRLADGLLNGFEGEIERVDQRHGRALVSFTFERTRRSVWVGYEYID